MRIVYILDSAHHFGYHESIVRSLCARGHRVQALFNERESRLHSDRAARTCQAEVPSLELGWFLRRKDFLRPLVFRSREMLSCASYFHRRDQSPYYRDRWRRRYAPLLFKAATRCAAGRAILAGSPAQTALRWFERIVPPDTAIRGWLKRNKPDVLVVSPANCACSEEVEYIKAGKALGIPTVLPVLTWDNLTTKGLIHVLPGLTLAWNRTHVKEAMTIHGVPQDAIVITGSPLFDKWFQAPRLLMDRPSFCRRVGLDPSMPFLAYLGSSKAIAPDETWLVRELLACLRNQADEELRNMGILVRPHPAHAEVHRKLEHEGIPVWPREGMLPDTEEAVRDFYNTLRHCVAAVGINTTGMMDAVIVDRPCVTVLTERYQMTQEDAVHFTHLLAADVLEVTRSADECVRRIRSILDGGDSKRDLRRKFVREFVRPRGLGRSAGQVAATAIEMAARGCTGPEIDAGLGSAPDA